MSVGSHGQADRLLDAITLGADIYDQATIDCLEAVRRTLLRTFAEPEQAHNAIQSILNDIDRRIETLETGRRT